MSRKHRGLSDADLKLWQEVTRTTRPFLARESSARIIEPPTAFTKGSHHKRKLKVSQHDSGTFDSSGTDARTPYNHQNLSPNTLKESSQKTTKELAPFFIGEKATDATVRDGYNHHKSGTRAPSSPIQMDSKTHRKIIKGKMRPEATLDLHGLTLAEAQSELNYLVAGAWARGMRFLLIITGKGKRKPDYEAPIPQRVGVLRHQVPLWLGRAPLNSMVLHVTQAEAKHGGSGAYYVYLRRRPVYPSK